MFPVNELQLLAPGVDEGAPPGADCDVPAIVDLEPEWFAFARLSRLCHHNVKCLLDDHQICGMEVFKDVRTDDVLRKVSSVRNGALIEPAELSLRGVFRYKLVLAGVQLDRTLLERLGVGGCDGYGRDEHVDDLLPERRLGARDGGVLVDLAEADDQLEGAVPRLPLLDREAMLQPVVRSNSTEKCPASGLRLLVVVRLPYF